MDRSTSGLQVLARNYLDVYPYENWTDAPMPIFEVGEQYQPSRLEMKEGRTSAPQLLTEADLITTMDRNGIGTDATIAEHIKKILDRGYGRRVWSAVYGAYCCFLLHFRAAFKENIYFVPSKLGLALVEGYDEIGFDSSLAKPHLRSAVCNISARVILTLLCC